ncbi:MAG: caspase family protein [Deltaproteobacteria bacterium]|nr:caspase family protein [Deltaproteobacteria bacterium]
MKVAILIGVTNYKNGLSNLPACSKDIKAIYELINLSGEYKQILFLDNIQSSTQIKRELCDFTEKYREEVEQVFFYFTGHGLFKDNEFYFGLPDYSERELSQSCLENSELDQLLRNMKPNVAVKIVDACQSGFSYIKNPERFKSYVDSSREGFQHCYFLFACQRDQSALIQGSLSDFTTSILEGLVHREDGDVRFKDLIDIVADKFRENQNQIPYFVTQASYHEVFFTMKSGIRNSMSKYLENDHSSVQVPNQIDAQSNSLEPPLEQRLKEASRSYCSKEDAINAWRVVTKCLSHFKLPNELEAAYAVSYSETDKKTDLPDTTPIGEWLEQNVEEWFAKPKYAEKWIPDRGWTSNLYPKFSNWGQSGYYQEYLTGYDVTTKSVYNYLKVEAESSYPSLDLYRLFVVPFISQQKLAIVSIVVSYKKTDWLAQEIRNEPSWSFFTVNLRETTLIESHVNDMQTKFIKALYSHISNRLCATAVNSQEVS